MARRKLALADLLSSKFWLVISAGTTAACVALAIQILQDPTFLPLPSTQAKLLITFCILLGVPAGLYGIVATALLMTGSSRARELVTLRHRVAQLEQLVISHRARIDELATLREVAYVVNLESDFAIIAEKALRLIAELMEPACAAIFLIDEPGAPAVPFVGYADGKLLNASKVRARSLPKFDMGEFQSHGIICRFQKQALHAMIPLKVQDEILGVLLLVFHPDPRGAPVQIGEFNDSRRALVQEIAQHISLAVKTKHLHMKSVVDGLTQLYSKSHFAVQLAAQVELANRKGESFSLVLCDLDHFKQVNDTYGHAAGDVVLAGVAERLRAMLRKYDSGYRIGGEEMAVLLPRTDLAAAARVAERLRGRIEKAKFQAHDGTRFQITISCGVAQYRMGESAEDLFSRADSRLYEAKQVGRNCVVPAAG